MKKPATTKPSTQTGPLPAIHFTFRDGVWYAAPPAPAPKPNK